MLGARGYSAWDEALDFRGLPKVTSRHMFGVVRYRLSVARKPCLRVFAIHQRKVALPSHAEGSSWFAQSNVSVAGARLRDRGAIVVEIHEGDRGKESRI